MNNLNNKNLYRPCIGGIILLILTVIGLISSVFTAFSNAAAVYSVRVPAGKLIQFLGSSMFRRILTTALPTIATGLITQIPILIFAVLLTMKKHNMALVIVSAITVAVNLLSGLYGGISLIVTYSQRMPRFVYIAVFSLISSLVRCVFYAGVMLLCIKATGRNSASAAKLRFLPLILFLVSTLFSLVYQYMNLTMTVSHRPLAQQLTVALPILFLQLLFTVPNVIAWFLACGWIANPFKRGLQPPQPQYRVPQYQVPQYHQPQQPQYQSPQYSQPQQPGWQGNYGQNPPNPGR